MIQKIPYTCRFCGVSHIAEYDDECPGLHVEKWMKIICCNKCADFKTERKELTDGIAAACRVIQIHNYKGSGLPPNVESELRLKLEKLTKRYASIMCEHLHLTNVWDADFVQQFMDKPDKWGVILKFYVLGLRSLVSEKPMFQPSRQMADP